VMFLILGSDLTRKRSPLPDAVSRRSHMSPLGPSRIDADKAASSRSRLGSCAW
jgi:hypothetical protein